MSPAGRPEPTFLLGVGCQKGGTAWMHRYLESSPQCDPGFRKEYHVWDALDLPSGRLARERIEKQGGPRARFLHEPEHYFDYFSGLLGPGRARLTADITPAYAGLSADRLGFVRAGFESRGVRPVAAYLMRDPVERIWSAVRMDVQRRGAEHADDAQAVEARLRVVSDDDQYARRTRYDQTIGRLDETFGGAVFYGFYERLFEAGTLQDLCAFLGIDFVEPDVGRQVNVSPKRHGELSDETASALARRFAPVYRSVEARFPDVDLAALWPSMGYLT